MPTDLPTPLSTAVLTAALTGFTLMASLIVAIGAQNSFVLRQGLRREHVGAVVLVCAALDITLTTLGVAGLGASLGQSPRVLDALGLAGAAVLVAYGVAAWRRALSPHALQAASGGAAPVARSVVLGQVLSISLLNPHVYLDTVVLAGAIGAQQAPALRPAFLLGAGLASTLWFALLGYGARLLTPLFARPLAWQVLDGLIGATMFGIAWQLAAGALHLA